MIPWEICGKILMLHRDLNNKQQQTNGQGCKQPSWAEVKLDRKIIQKWTKFNTCVCSDQFWMFPPIPVWTKWKTVVTSNNRTKPPVKCQFRGSAEVPDRYHSLLFNILYLPRPSPSLAMLLFMPIDPSICLSVCLAMCRTSRRLYLRLSAAVFCGALFSIPLSLPTRTQSHTRAASSSGNDLSFPT